MDDTKQVGILSAVTNWFAHPFNADGSAFNWIMFVGLLFCAAWLWNTGVLFAIKETA